MIRRKRGPLRRAVLVMAAADVLLAVIVAALLIAVPRRQTAQREKTARRVGVTEDMSASLQQELFAQAVGEALNHVHLASEARAAEGQVNIRLFNGEDSPCRVAMELVLADTRERIAVTGYIEPGYWLEYAELSRELPAGEYECIARLLFYLRDDGSYLGAAARQVLMNVQ